MRLHGIASGAPTSSGGGRADRPLLAAGPIHEAERIDAQLAEVALAAAALGHDHAASPRVEERRRVGDVRKLLLGVRVVEREVHLEAARERAPATIG